MAIAMYGYSWLKPAGCPKTMLGRREEEVEREEVDRQLREVEMQERMAMEADEQERIARMRETGEVEEGRDLDEDIPDADEDVDEGEEFDSDEGDVAREAPVEDEEGLAVDLDDEIPDADDLDTEEEDDEALSPAGADGGWVYDTRREPDTDDEEQLPREQLPRRVPQYMRPNPYGVVRASDIGNRSPGYDYDYDEREAEDLADEMLDEDEGHAQQDLDDDVPEADEDQSWEHTDTELEESEMDISILPEQVQLQHSRPSGLATTQQPRRISARVAATNIRSSGPWITGPSPSPIQAAAPAQPLPRHRNAATTPNAATATSSGLRSTSTRAARIVSGNRQRPYRPDRIHLPTTRLHQAHAPAAEMVNTPPLATAAARADLDLDLDVGEERGEEEEEDITAEELDTDVDEEDINVETPDPFVAPEHVRAIAQQRAGRTGRGQAVAAQVAAEPAGDLRRPTETGTTTVPTHTTTQNVNTNANPPNPRRTLFQRATRRRNPNPTFNPEINTGGASGSTSTSAGVGGTSSGGLFSSPNIGDAQDVGEGGTARGWDTPSAPAEGSGSADGGGGGERRRSGRFLGGRRRGA